MLESLTIGDLGPLTISAPTLIIEIVVFLLMVWVMERLVFEPIRRAWAERDRLIQEGLASSSEGRDEVERAREEVHRILLEARRGAQQALDEATAAGNKKRDELIEQASAEFQRLVEAARRQIAEERNRSAETLRERIVDIALQAASRVSGQSYDRPEVRRLAATVVQREGLA